MKHEFKAGDFARSIESGWLGQIQEVLPTETVWIDDKTSFTETMVKMVGVDQLALVVGGLDLVEAISPDDVQWFSTDDIRPVKQKVA